MQVDFFNYLGDKKAFNKNLTTITSINNCSAIDTLHLNHNLFRFKRADIEAIENYKNINYIYVDEFERYFFVDEKTFDGAFVIFDCTVDVLMSHKQGIYNTTATIDRNENESNAYLIDDKYKSYSYRQITCKSFANGLTHDNLILMSVG